MQHKEQYPVVRNSTGILHFLEIKLSKRNAIVGECPRLENEEVRLNKRQICFVLKHVLWLPLERMIVRCMQTIRLGAVSCSFCGRIGCQYCFVYLGWNTRRRLEDYQGLDFPPYDVLQKHYACLKIFHFLLEHLM